MIFIKVINYQGHIELHCSFRRLPGQGTYCIHSNFVNQIGKQYMTNASVVSYFYLMAKYIQIVHVWTAHETTWNSAEHKGQQASCFALFGSFLVWHAEGFGMCDLYLLIDVVISMVHV